MAAIIVRNVSAETHRALRAQARRHRRSTEAEVRAILDDAVRPTPRVGLGSRLAALAKPFRGLDLSAERDQTPVEPMDLE
jgi:antitoxin FitA